MGFMTSSVPVDQPVPAEQVPVIVIDAGHGGFDGGAEAADGTEEKNINLAIAEKLAEEAAGSE
ncbi:MAG: N-acetylmuramoyl-L-alanine amidase, partial [Firmicutes bacterium]|nr:N-acetylmuramoyl-L-alanine amidase [Bacillota bacterium]